MSYFLKRGENEKKKIPLITDGRVNTFIANPSLLYNMLDVL